VRATVVQQALTRDGVDLPQWYVATADGILIFGPFSSVKEAVETARAAQNIPTEGRNER
jgi:hypothetical protein